MTLPWQRSEYPGLLAAWGILDTGQRPRTCSVEGCKEPRRGATHYECAPHVSQKQKTHRDRTSHSNGRES